MLCSLGIRLISGLARDHGCRSCLNSEDVRNFDVRGFAAEYTDSEGDSRVE